eukprot:3766576-Pyramimonas_sp.AAC.1
MGLMRRRRTHAHIRVHKYWYSKKNERERAHTHSHNERKLHPDPDCIPRPMNPDWLLAPMRASVRWAILVRCRARRRGETAS